MIMWKELCDVWVNFREKITLDSWKKVDSLKLDLTNESDKVIDAVHLIVGTENIYEIVSQIDLVIYRVVEILKSEYWVTDEIDIKKITFKKWWKESVIKVWEWNMFTDFIQKIFKKKRKKHKK